MPASEKDFILPLYTPSPLRSSSLLSPHSSDPPAYEMGNNISTLCAGNRYHDDSALTRASMSFELNSVAIEPGPTTPLSLRASNAQSSAASHANANTDVKPKTQTQPWSCCQSLAQNMDGLATAWTPFFKQLFCKRLVLAVLFILTVYLLASGKINLVDLVRARYGTGDANKP